MPNYSNQSRKANILILLYPVILTSQEKQIYLYLKRYLYPIIPTSQVRQNKLVSLYPISTTSQGRRRYLTSCYTQSLKRQVSMTRKWHNHKLQTNLRHHKEDQRHRKLTATQQQEDKQSKLSNQLPLPKWDDCKTERTLSTAEQTSQERQIHANYDRYTQLFQPDEGGKIYSYCYTQLFKPIEKGNYTVLILLYPIILTSQERQIYLYCYTQFF